ncbi:bifunctional adenosylcobinamide kinase/adenosylcobinamide-phosphate guanylyltransferase [Jeotgalibacillus proteolyticus]|uniref:Adenosylcobinamide kinase n=1 Tax=Jeotgalibacillus proteolyticus TaxID=2082395 RepID=A0A2S5G9R9_9BACL|nr:bifunctional adenosylcobinamide kinase/adenosylcobinamide-phosphate guanylyltransferase [Jeotgalibacillus proteolyticus]PPA69663.1 cobinamide kinase [Jeotgalibacillus proteolyticus]
MAKECILIVIGGVRSGKTSWSEEQSIRLAKKENQRMVYLASGVAFDQEMKNRISRHQLDRSSEQWITIEQPVQIMESVSGFEEGDVVLWDCLTTWLANEWMESGIFSGGDANEATSRLTRELISFIDWARDHLTALIIVSNEVLSEPVSKNKATAAYQKAIGELHQTLVGMADTAVEMEAGIPIVRKGEWGM